MNVQAVADQDPESDSSFRNEWGLPSIRLRAEPLSAQNTQIDNSNRKNEALPWVVLVAIVACSTGGLALGLSIGARDRANEAERIAKQETRLQRLEIDELKVALQTQGLKVHEGSTP